MVGTGGIAFVDRILSPTLQTNPVSFPPTKKDDTASVYLVIRNRASYANVIQSITNATPEFQLQSFLSDTVAAGDSISVQLFFTPTSFGSFSDNIVISSDSGTFTVPLSGSSPASSVLISHTFLGFGTVTTDTSKVRPIFLSTTSINGLRVDSIYTKTAAFS
jgi:hypothetical protein